MITVTNKMMTDEILRLATVFPSRRNPVDERNACANKKGVWRCIVSQAWFNLTNTELTDFIDQLPVNYLTEELGGLQAAGIHIVDPERSTRLWRQIQAHVDATRRSWGSAEDGIALTIDNYRRKNGLQ